MTYDPSILAEADPSVDKKNVIDIFLLSADSISFEDELFEKLGMRAKNWIKASKFRGSAGEVLLVPDDEGELACVILGIGPHEVDNQVPMICGALPAKLPSGTYQLVNVVGENAAANRNEGLDVLAFALGAYRFNRYKSSAIPPNKKADRPVLQSNLTVQEIDEIRALATSIALGRDLITTPANDMGPVEIADAALDLAKTHEADFNVIIGDDLLINDFPMVHAVGRASDRAPRLVDITHGEDDWPKVTLIGKGVAFDTGGLDIKPASAMLLMKKDMGGAANVLALGNAILSNRLKIRLRILIPAVENAISGNAFRPGDILSSRSGRTVEIGNTDAEGRLVLADALSLACEEHPDLIIDMATLTGAARVALGTDVPALFSNDSELAAQIQAIGLEQKDPLWHMPLWQGYRKHLDSKVADINHISSGGYGGAITAALFLQEFVDPEIRWMHIDLMAYNSAATPGKPVGGEVQGMRTLYTYLKTLYG